MKIPLEWLKEYVDLEDLTTKEIGDAFTQLGLMLDKPFDGKVFDLEHRFDRSDWLSILGCARDLVALLDRDLKLPKSFMQEGKKQTKDQLVDIKVDCPDAVNRFNTRVFRNVAVKSSPEWLKTRLEAYGIPSINNIVDITNYVMVELGQPMHAQDLAKFRKPEIVIRKAHNEEKIVTFLGDEVTLYPDAFVLTQDGVATVLGGIVGGRETGVDQNTKNIILDAGNYDQNVIRKVSRKLKIQNETVLRYDKFLHPDLTQYAIERATYLIQELAGGEYYQNIDWNPKEYKPKHMTLRYSRILQLAGFEVAQEKVEKILTKLGYTVNHKTSDGLELTVPYFRTDVEVEDDIVSDILRINGYAKIPTAQIQSAPPKEVTPEIYKLEDRLRDCMVNLGAHEHITDPLVSSALSRNENLAGNQIILENSQNSQKNALRTNIAETLQELVPNYTKNKISSGTLFEIGKIYTQKDGKKIYESYQETRVLECLVFDKNKSPKELHKLASSLLGGLLKNIGIQDFRLTKTGHTEASIEVSKKTIGTIHYNGFTILTEELIATKNNTKRILTDIKQEKSVELSLIVPKTTLVGDIISTIASEDFVDKVEFFEEYSGKELELGNRSILLEFTFSNKLEDNKIKDRIDAINKILTVKFNSKIRV